jgi:hypothetical protein
MTSFFVTHTGFAIISVCSSNKTEDYSLAIIEVQINFCLSHLGLFHANGIITHMLDIYEKG